MVLPAAVMLFNIVAPIIIGAHCIVHIIARAALP